MRPAARFLDPGSIDRIVGEARDVLRRLGLEIQNPAVVSLLADHGAEVDGSRVRFPGDLVDRCLRTAPRGFRLYDALGRQTHDLAGDAVHFTPGSSALRILDSSSGAIRLPVTSDYVAYAKLVARLDHIAAQSTAFIPSDVPEGISDSYRLYLSLLVCEKPVVTGAFSAATFAVMRDLLLAARGSEEALRDRPFAVFSCAPISPLKWGRDTSQNVVDCARSGVPVEFVAMPLAGFLSPVTLVGTLVQHTAETLSGVVISQCASPGAPVLYGGSPAVFDVRYETTPMGAIETMMLDCAVNEIGKSFGLPTQAYVALSDSKALDAQAGMETGMGAVLAALSGINSVSGPGMLDFENCQSLEKLLLDNEVCGMALRMTRGIEPREDFPSLERFEELVAEGHLLISRHSRKYLRQEHYFPGPVVNRASLTRWQEEGGTSLWGRARSEVERLVASAEPSGLADDAKRDLTARMLASARACGLDELPPTNL